MVAKRVPRLLGVVGLVVCLPLAALAAGSVDRWAPSGADSAQHAQLGRVTLARGAVRISGSATTQLYPGGFSPVALRFTNRTGHVLRLGRVKVSVKKVVSPTATATHPCTRTDFAVTQMKRWLPRLPTGKHTLTSLRVPVQYWPRVTMRNRPVNQDGCKGARLVLGFKARARR